MNPSLEAEFDSSYCSNFHASIWRKICNCKGGGRLSSAVIAQSGYAFVLQEQTVFKISFGDTQKMTQKKKMEMLQVLFLSSHICGMLSWGSRAGLDFPIRPDAASHRNHCFKQTFPLGSKNWNGVCQFPYLAKIILILMSKGSRGGCFHLRVCRSIWSLKWSNLWMIREDN